MAELEAIIHEIKSQYKKENLEGMARFGINTENAYGASIPFLRKIAKRVGKNHKLALELWATGIHDARNLAGFIGDPLLVTEKQADSWAEDFDSWDVCDLCCGNLFDKTPFAWKKAVEWSKRDEEYVKRAGFALMAALAVHDKAAGNSKFESLYPLIKRASTDERNFVRKAVNWALRQIGKRNKKLNASALKLAKEIQKIDSKSARWIAADAIRELESEAVKKRLLEKSR
jgi:3-methyladenine DNA glycosylase AlkD